MRSLDVISRLQGISDKKNVLAPLGVVMNAKKSDSVPLWSFIQRLYIVPASAACGAAVMQFVSILRI